MDDLIERFKAAIKLLYVHGMLTEQERERAERRVQKMADRVEATE